MARNSQNIIPNLWFDSDAEDAAEFYVSVFDRSAIGQITQYDEAFAAAAGQPVGSVMTVSFELEGYEFVALNGGPHFSITPAISFLVKYPAVDAVDEAWDQLSDGGTALMPLDTYPFSENYGWVEDRYGVSWQVMYTHEVPNPTIVPSLMFVGDNCGRAMDAVSFYTSVFDDATIGEITRYGPDQEPDEEGTIAYADFILAGQTFAVMDSAHEHDFTFTEAVSLEVRCDSHPELDEYWDQLSAVPDAEQCGWLKDKYGVSWQIVPAELPELLYGGDAETATRVAKAMLQMKKLDIDTLHRVAAGAT